MIDLRPYQSELASLAREEMRHHKNVLVTLPTGGGKTFTGCSILKSFCSLHPDERAVVMVHREELISQWFNSLVQMGITPGLMVSGKNQITQPVTLAMVETMNRRVNKNPQLAKQFKFGIADEAHIGNHFKVLEAMDCRTLGLTATPVSSNRSKPLKKIYGSIVSPYTEKDLIELGHLLPAITYSQEYDFSSLKKQGKDFSAESQLAEFTKPKLYDGACREYLRLCKGSKSGAKFHKAICFNVNVEHSLEQLKVFQAQGIRCLHVDGKTPKEERKQAFHALKVGDIDVLHNVGVATVGLDETSLEAIILNRATSSLSLYVQMCGRGARPHEFGPFAKLDHFKIIDMGANYSRHGLFGSGIDWKQIFQNEGLEQSKGKAGAPKECPECGARIAVSAKECPYCDHEFTAQEIEDAETDGMNAKQIREYKFQHLPPHLRKPKKELTNGELHEYGRAMGYNQAWAWKQIKLREQYARRRWG